ncbi:hypothetical protein C3489_02630 [Streptomyces sp. Ru71]|nr:hypothetical protein C3489_02630 [Streptomyces sp. Ru71]
MLLDAEDTAVTRRTAHALTRAGGVAAARLLSVAVTEADDNQADWIRTGVQDALEDRPTGVPALRAACRQLTRSPEEAVRRGAGAILAWTEPTGR